MIFIDTHCHLGDEAFSGEEDAYIARARAAGVGLMLQPDIDSSEREAMFSLVRRHPEELRPMIGLYPGSVTKEWRSEIDTMVRFLDDWEAEDGRKVVAIGEIGLDYHEGKEFVKEQKDALEWQLDFARQRDLPVNIHLRDAMGDFIEIIRRHKGLRGNMHAYSGSLESFRELEKLGDWYIGVGGVCGLRILLILTVFRWYRHLSILYASFPISWVIVIAILWVAYRILYRRLLERSKAETATPAVS